MSALLPGLILVASAACAGSPPDRDTSPADRHVEENATCKGNALSAGTSLHGWVMSARKGNVGIGLGSNDGIRVGDSFDVWRAGDHVGYVRITAVRKDQASSVFISSSATTHAPPLPGDWVSIRRERKHRGP